MRNTQRTRGAAIVYALVFAALLGLTGLAILATQARSTRNAGTVTNRALERATADAAIEHGKALVQQAIGAQAIDLEQLADLDVTNDQLNGLEYRLDLSLAPYGDIRADLVGTREWAAARLDPLTGQPLRHLTSNVNIEALTLQGEWRDALVHHPAGEEHVTLGIYQDGVYRRESTDPGPIPIPFPELNAPPAQVAARGSTSGTRTEIGVLLDATGRVWEWPLNQSTPPQRLTDLAGVTSVTTGERYALALTETGDLYGWGYNPRGPLRPTSASMGETLQTITRLDMPIRDNARPTLIAIASGDNHVLALDTQGRIWAWGANHNQQLGRSCGSVCAADTLMPFTDLPIVSVSAGGTRSAALDQGGNLFVWGAGQLTRLLAHPDGTPVRVTHYSLSSTEGLALTHDGQLVRFTTNIAQPLELRVITNATTGRSTTVTRADLLRAGSTHHVAIVGATLITWPAGESGTPTADTQARPGQLTSGEHEALDGMRVTSGDRSLTLAWAGTDEELTYEVHHSHDARAWALAGQTVSPAYHVADLTNGQPYFVRVTALDPYGEVRREHTSGPHTPAGPPGTPTNGRVTPLHEALELAWDAPPNNGNPITHYRVEQSSNGTVWQTLPFEPTQPSVRLTSLENGRAYHHRVSAVNSAGRSHPLVLPTGTPQGPPAPPELERVDGHHAGGTAAITLTWQPAPGATSYRAHYSQGGDTWSSQTAAGGATSLTITGLQDNASYTAYLVAVNQHGDSQPSRRVTITTKATPSSPRDLSTSPSTETEIRLDWSPPASGAPIAEYRVERRDQAGGTWRVIGTPTGETHVDRGLEPGRVYAYRVAAVNQAGVGAYTAPMQAVTALTPPGQPSRPRLLFVTLDSLTIAWEAPTDRGGAPSLTYRVERREDLGAWTTLTTHHDTTTYPDANVQAGREYTYRITASNSAHAGPASEEATFAAADALITPSRPRVTSREHLTINLEWDTLPTPGVTAYLLERAEQGAPFTALTTLPAQPGATQAYADTRVTAGQSYAYRVRAQTQAGVSDPSPASDDVIALARPTAPRDLTATLNLQSGTIGLEWAAPSDVGGAQVIGYRIQRNTDDEGWITLTDTVGPTTSQVDESVELGREHSYRVAAVTSLGVEHLSPYSPPTGPVKAMRTPGQPNAPTVEPGPINPAQPLVRWLAPNDNGAPITRYQLERHDGNAWRPHAELPGHETQYLDQGAQAGGAYRYRVTATNDAGDSDTSSPSEIFQAHPALPAPQAPTLQHVGARHLMLTWEAPSGVSANSIQGYRLERRAGDSEWQVLAPHTGSAHTTYDDLALQAGVTYQYRVAAINQAGVTGAHSAPSNALTATDVPAAPAAPTATVSPGHVDVTWSAPASPHAPITGYALQRRARLDSMPWGAWSTITTTSGTSASDASLARNTTYQYRVTAMNPAGESQPGAASLIVTPQLASEPPTTPTLSLQIEENRSVRASWSQPSRGERTYEISYDMRSTTGSQRFTFTTSATTAVLPMPRAGATADIAIRAQNTAGWSDWSAPAPVYNPMPPAPGAPTVTGTSPGISIAWRLTTAHTNYLIEREESPDGQRWNHPTTFDASGGWAFDRSPQPSTHYRYRVAPVNPDGSLEPWSSWSQPARVPSP